MVAKSLIISMAVLMQAQAGHAQVPQQPQLSLRQAVELYVREHYAKRQRLLRVQRAPIPAEAVAMAWTDVQTLPVSVQPYTRYIWVPTKKDRSARAMSYIVNSTVSQSRTPNYHAALYDNQLIRLNLEQLADDSKDFAKVQNLAARWDEIPNPYFRIETSKEIVTEVIEQVKVIKVGGARVLSGQTTLITAPIDELFILDGVQDGWFKVTVDGKTGFIRKNEAVIVKTEVNREIPLRKIRNMAEHTNLAIADKLQRITQCNNPVVRHDAFLQHTFDQLNGGRYYDWIGIPRASAEQKKQGLTDLKVLLLSLGVQKEDIENVVREQRVAMFRSGVTGKPRGVDVFKGLQSRAAENEGRIFVTNDVREGDVDPKRHPMRNLRDCPVAGHEVIWEWENGTMRYALYNEAESLVDEVPQEIATDHEIPRPHSTRLRPGISCLRCHGMGSFKGIQPLKNDVRDRADIYRKRYPQLDIFDDASDTKGIVPEILKELASEYAGDLTKPLMRSRDDAEWACYKMTGGDSGGLTYQQMTAEVTSIYNSYVYDLVTPQVACRELGFIAEDEETAVEILNRLLPRLPDTLGQGFSEEDPIIGYLKDGISVNRLGWEQAYVDAMNRTMLTIIQGGKLAQQQQQEAEQEALKLDSKKE